MHIHKAIAGLGFAAVAGGVARMAMTPFALIWGTDSAPELWAGLIACWLMAVGSLGLFLFQSSRTGLLGFASSVALAVANMITSCLVWSTMLGAEQSGYEAVRTIDNVLMLFGLIAFGFVTWRAGKLPRWAAILLVVWPFLSYVPLLSNYIALLWGLAYIGLGLPVWLGREKGAA